MTVPQGASLRVPSYVHRPVHCLGFQAWHVSYCHRRRRQVQMQGRLGGSQEKPNLLTNSN
jgi:hypothetical protein